MEFTTAVIADQKYKLEIISLFNCLKAYDEVEVKLNPSRIESLFPNPTDGQITVSYKINNATDAYIVVTNSSYFTYSFTTVLNVTENSVILNMQEYPAGIYAVSLYCDGEIVETKTFIKE